MRKKQQKVDTFLSALKVGDKVVTTGGGLRTAHSASARRACSCKSPTRSGIEVARASIGGYQGQDPVVESTESSTT